MTTKVLVSRDLTKAMRGAFHRANDLIEEGDEAANRVGSPDFQWQQMLAAYEASEDAPSFCVETYVEDYEYCGDADYAPNDFEKKLLTDAIHGALAAYGITPKARGA